MCADTGLDDDSYNAYLGYRPNDRHTFFLRANRYRAEETGFGYVDPGRYRAYRSRRPDSGG